jgi:hypothetical protein
LALVTPAASACGKKGPPLPPLVLVPVAPNELTAVRRGPQVDLSFGVPGANTDRSTPADLARIEVYALTVPAPVNAEDVIRRGTRVSTMPINEPPDPDEPEPETPVPPRSGLSQGDVARISEPLPEDADAASYRAYVAVGVNHRGRRGTPSSRVAVPLVPSPAAVALPAATYDEKAISVTWPPVQAESGDAYTYTIYAPGTEPKQLTSAPLTDPLYSDTGIVWEQERCYEVRAGRTVEGVRTEGAASPPVCVTPHDTFAPAPPQGLVAVGSEGAISLIWTPNSEPDLAGYVVLRAVAPATEMTPLSDTPTPETNLRDNLPAGSQATYAVLAVDRSGNRSGESAPTTETAR